MTLRRFGLLAGLTPLLLCGAAPAPVLEVELEPAAAGGVVTGVAVTERAPALDIAAGQPLASLPIVATNIPGALADPKTLQASDADGVLPLTIDDDPPDPSNFKQERRWRVGRTTHGPVTIRYVATPRTITPTTRAGPLIDVRTEGAGVYGSARTLLALPTSGWPMTVRLRWNLSHLPKGSRAISSLGEGGAERRLSREELTGVFFMAGPLKTLPASGDGPFVVTWITDPPWDLAGASDWTRRAYAYFERFWGYPSPFHVFMRTTARFQGGGGGGFHSFVFGTVEGEKRDPIEVRELMAHEASHSFVGGLRGDSAAGGQWYSEGADVYYTAVLTHRAGLTSLQRYGETMNTLVAQYFLNPLSHASNEEVTRRFFSSKDAEVVSYQRGPLYFATVDARLRAASAGKRRVDDLVRQMVGATKAGRGATRELWLTLVRGALGEPGVAEFEAMMRGAPLDLPADLLGPCFRRESVTYRAWRPGYRALAGDGGVQRAARLEPDSPATRAGVQEGDVLLDPEPKPTDPAGDGAPRSVRVRRGAQTLALAVEGWGPAVAGWRYVRTATPASACGI